jgi:uncharacterized protein YqcC (DUF446 family)
MGSAPINVAFFQPTPATMMQKFIVQWRQWVHMPKLQHPCRKTSKLKKREPKTRTRIA